jgi:transcriptional regulator with XRE-family HTH domain
MAVNKSLDRVLAARIRRARREMPHENGRGVSQATFSNKLGVHWVTVSNWERGKGVPSIENLMAIAAVTEKPLAFFTDGDEDEEDEEALRRLAALLIERHVDDIALELLGRVQRMTARREAEGGVVA